MRPFSGRARREPVEPSVSAGEIIAPIRPLILGRLFIPRGYKLDGAVAYARANRLNRVTVASRRPRYGIVTTGKAFNDVRQALFDLGIDDRTADDIGITVLKIAMPYPFDTETVRDFADGLEELFVVEEKVTLTELQVRNALYPLPDARRPRVIGHTDEAGRVLLPGFPEISPEDVARALAARIAHFQTSLRIDERDARSFSHASRAVKARRSASPRIRISPRTGFRTRVAVARIGNTTGRSALMGDVVAHESAQGLSLITERCRVPS